VGALLRVRAQVNEAIEPLRAAGKLGKSLDAAVTLHAAPEDPLTQVLEKHRDFLPELFIVSDVSLDSAIRPSVERYSKPAPLVDAPTRAGAALLVTVRPCSELNFVRCPHCWRWVPVLETGTYGEVCPRCAEALRF
jgi:isoleucyl-tRNA synthetase